ncbi:hydroxymethylglutaryl-CoA lyase [Naumannella sp. ID2617S]|nr:hydroxymethylglutaryl-CoA lyase [Naumannella sp. ID2617S]
MQWFPDVRRPAADLPPRVTVFEVGARDGLQAEKQTVTTATKVELINRLMSAGLTHVEATSFVSPKWVPQLADAAEVMAAIERPPGVCLPVLVPNQRGLERALAAGAQDVAVFVSATEAFARANLNTTVEGALEMVAPVVTDARAAGVRVRGYVSMCWGDPWQGPVPAASVVRVTDRLLELGCHRVSLGDTIGVATAGGVHQVLQAHGDHGIAPDQLALHFHDTYGQALTNVYAGLQFGVTEFDSSAGGLGGCPYAHSATGNLATEDLVWMLHGLGIETGVNLAALVATSVWLARRLGRPSPSRVVNALAGRIAPEHDQQRGPRRQSDETGQD